MDIMEFEKYIRHYVHVNRDSDEKDEVIVKEIVETVKNKETKHVSINDRFFITVFGNKTSELLENDSKGFFVFKEKRDHKDKGYFLFLIDGDTYKVISTNVRFNIIKNEFIEKYNLKTNIFLVSRYEVDVNDLSYFDSSKYHSLKSINKNEMINLLGKDEYKNIFSFFVRLENLVLKNGILQIY